MQEHKYGQWATVYIQLYQGAVKNDTSAHLVRVCAFLSLVVVTWPVSTFVMLNNIMRIYNCCI